MLGIIAVLLAGVFLLGRMQTTGKFYNSALSNLFGSYCGNKICESSESSSNCCQDCGCGKGYNCIDNKCQPVCGDGVCQPEETCQSCPKDCTREVTKTKTVYRDNCDYTEGCSCTHKTWWGLGGCDICECEYTETECIK